MREFRGAVIGFVAGALLLGAAGTSLSGSSSIGEQARATARRTDLPRVAADGTVAPDGAQLPQGQFLVGAAKTSISPDPSIWVPDDPAGRCSAEIEGCLETFDGYFAKSVREYGVWVRALAISNGAETIILAVSDTVGWFRFYPEDVCGDCGSEAIRARLETELGVPAENMVISATHTHAAGNTVGSIPTWYYEQVRDATLDAMRDAYDAMVPAVIDVGTTTSRWNNQDRRIITRAVPDYEVQWLRALDASGETVGVLYNFAAHATVLAANDTLHSGFAGAASDKLESELGGGTAMFIASGLGNQKVVRSRGIDGLGHRLADVILRDMVESPRRLQTNDIASDIREIPVIGDNMVMLAARAAEIFVRDILPPAGGGPATGAYGKSDLKPSCAGAGPLTINTLVGGLRVGEAAIMTAPGEIFSTISLVTKDYLEDAEVVFVLALANDQLGYIIPYEEFDETAHQGPGLAANSIDVSQYEEVLSIGRCVGEQIMDELLASGRTLGFVN